MSILSHPQWSGPHNTNPEKGPKPVVGEEFSAGGDTEPRAALRMRRHRSSVWREQVRDRLADLHVELESLPAAMKSDAWQADARRRHHEATAIIDRNPSLVSAWTGVDVEGTWMRIHAIEVALVRLSTSDVIRAKLPRIVADGSQLLGDDHPRVKVLRAYQKRPRWDAEDRECLAHSIRAVYEEADKENVRLRSFRNILFGATIVFTFLAILFAVFGAISPGAVDLLSRNPLNTGVSLSDRQPTSTDVLAVEFLGLISAALVGAVAIRRIHGTSTAYGVPMASLLLKLPTGALTALAGMLMIRAGFVQLPNPTGGAPWAAYALLFGASQQGFTGLVDRQAHNVLDHVTSKDNG